MFFAKRTFITVMSDNSMSIVITINPDQPVGFPAKHGYKSKYSTYLWGTNTQPIQIQNTNVVCKDVIIDMSNYICINCSSESEHCSCSDTQQQFNYTGSNSQCLYNHNNIFEDSGNFDNNV